MSRVLSLSSSQITGNSTRNKTISTFERVIMHMQRPWFDFEFVYLVRIKTTTTIYLYIYYHHHHFLCRTCLPSFYCAHVEPSTDDVFVFVYLIW